MAVIYLNNLDDESRVSFGILNNLTLVNMLNQDYSLQQIYEGFGTDFSVATATNPQSNGFDYNWINFNNVRIIAALNRYILRGSVATDGWYLHDNAYYQYKNSRYVRVTDGTYSVYQPLDPDNPDYTVDTLLGSSRMAPNGADRCVAAYHCATNVPVEMTLSEFRQTASAALIFSRGIDRELEVVTSYEGLSGLVGSELDWIYYLVQGTEMDPDPEPKPPSDDPYNPVYPPGGEDPGSGDRPPYDEGDDIPIPDLPPFNLADSGFTSLWIPSGVTLGLLASYLWSDNVIDTVIKKLYANPIDVIISLGIVPFNVTPDGTAEICVGTHGTGVSSAYVNSDCVIVDCGDINIEELQPGGYLNYSPYTQAKLFLPFVGFVDIDIDVAMNSTLHIEYHVCLTNGSFVVFVQSSNSNTIKVIAEFEGNMKITVPITAADYSSMWQAVLGTLTAPLLAAAGGAAAGAIGGQFIGASAALTSDFAAEGANQGLANSIGQGIGDAGNHITDKLSPNIACSGSFSAGSGMMGNRKPFIVLKSPEVKQPENYNKYRGYPLQAEKVLNELSGYTEISNIQLSLPGASGTEAGEAERLLRNGFIIGSGSKPAVQSDGITLCKNNSPINQINKQADLISQLNGDFRDSVNMMHPVVRIEKLDPTDFNYVYIGEFKRWYFVNKVDVVRTNILDLHLKEDVLESFATEILAHKAIVSNNASLYNVYLNDNQLITTQRSLYWRKEFPTGFMENDGYEWVLLIAGRRGTSN